MLVFNLPPSFAERSYGGPSWLLGDGIALVSDTRRVLQFIAYGADLVSTGSGPVQPNTRAEIIRAVDGIPASGMSVQLLGGPGMYAEDFSWSTAPMASTLSRTNPDQAFGQQTEPPIAITVRVLFYGSDAQSRLVDLLKTVSFAKDFGSALQVALQAYGVVVNAGDQISKVVGVYRGGVPAKADVFVELAAPPYGNSQPLPAWTAVRSSLVRGRTLYVGGFPLQVQTVLLGPDCDPGFDVSPTTGKCTVPDDGANGGGDDDDGVNTSDGPCSGGRSGPIATCFDCVRASSTPGCSWDQTTLTCNQSNPATSYADDFACTPYMNSCCAALAVGASGFAGSCPREGGAGAIEVPSTAVAAVASALAVSAEGAELYFGKGCNFLRSNFAYCAHYGFEQCVAASSTTTPSRPKTTSKAAFTKLTSTATATTAAKATAASAATVTATATSATGGSTRITVTATASPFFDSSTVPLTPTEPPGVDGSGGPKDKSGGKVAAGLVVGLLLVGAAFFAYRKRRSGSVGLNGRSGNAALYQNLQFDMQFENDGTNFDDDDGGSMQRSVLPDFN